MMKKTAALFLIAFVFVWTLPVAAQAVQAKVLRPPAGARVALVVFEDMQCPDCARAEPLLLEAVAKYKIPLVRYDFPLPQHDWSFDAHVIARWLDTQSKELGEKFRTWIFSNQSQITKANLRTMAERFASQNGTALPFIIDPKRELAAKVNADKEIGRQVGIQHTPTIYVVSNSRTGQPFIEVVDRRELFSLIENMQRQAGPATPSASGKKTGRTTAKPAPKKTGTSN